MSNELKIPLRRSDMAVSHESPVMAFLQKDISLFGNRIKDKVKERFYNDLHVLLSAGVDIKTALELFSEEQEKASQKKFFRDLTDEVIRGKSLSRVMEGLKVFSRYESVSIKIGEEAGKLTEILRELSGYFAKRIKLKRHV